MTRTPTQIPALPGPEARPSQCPPLVAAERIPSSADIAEAEAAYDAFSGRFGMAHDRADYIAKLARVAMQKRLEAEHRAQFAPKHRRAA